MSLESETHRYRITTSWQRVATLIGGSLLATSAKFMPSGRGALPDPVDVSNSVGNVLASGSMGVMVGVAGVLSASNREYAVESQDRGAFISRFRLKVGGAALALASAANLAVETKTSYNFLGWESGVTNHYDAFYGIVAGAVAGATVPKLQDIHESRTVINYHKRRPLQRILSAIQR